MPIIARSTADEQQDWRQILAQSLKTAADVRHYLSLPAISEHHQQQLHQASQQFSVLAPKPFLDLAEPGNPDDPITRQMLPDRHELLTHSGYSTDPLGEVATNVQPGIIHKYQGRALLLAATGCAINCRYCFRRHFDYADNRIKHSQWQTSLEYIRADTSLREVILSGGDPLMLQDKALIPLMEAIETIPHIQRLRIHSRLPVVIPQRLTHDLQQHLHHTRLQTTLVLHINHANEIGPLLRQHLPDWHNSSVTLLNQSVLLSGVNDDLPTLLDLSEQLFANGILPYYLHLLDKVQGAQHFEVSQQEARRLYQGLHAQLPGYLVPRLVQEEAGMPGKTLLSMS